MASCCGDCIHNAMCEIDGYISECKHFRNKADVVEVKHGKWFLLDECANEGVYCSVCYKKVYRTEYANQKIKSNYCPNCGAKMDGQTPQKLNHNSLCETETYKVGGAE